MSDCDIWEGPQNQHGYGRHTVYFDNKQQHMLAHRIVWMQDNGHTDLFILHSCDTPLCINIDHLRAGTGSDNMRDMVDRGRARKANSAYLVGNNNGKLSPSERWAKYGHMNKYPTLKPPSDRKVNGR
jgi:hypothetical protein